jgi:hypothetical protein
MATSFSSGRSHSTRKEPLNMGKQLANLSLAKEPLNMGKQLVNFITCNCESSAAFL